MGQLVRLKAIRDTGAPDSVIGEKLARTLNLNIGPTEDLYSTVGSAAEIKFAGVCRGVEVKLSERLVVTVNLYVVTGTTSLFLLANDVFNSGCCDIVGVVADKGYYVVQLGDVVDVVPFEK